jgi:ribosomal RNA-processing protein 9
MDLESKQVIKKFTHHRDTITALRFQRGTHNLFSASDDRSIKHYNVQDLTYIETLFGHQDKISTIDTNDEEKVLSCGSRDRTCRIFKIPEESQLIYRAGGGFKVHEDLVVMEELGMKFLT